MLELAAESGMEPHTIRKWLAAEGVEPVEERAHGKRGKFPYYDRDEALAAILPHKGAKKSAVNEDGLSWHQAKLREEVLELQRENERAEKLEAKEIMLTADHLQILASIIKRVEQVPSKAQSELALSASQVAGLRRMLDEAREAAAKEIENGVKTSNTKIQ